MKKLLALTVALLYLVSFTPAVLAADSATYELSELSMTITPPEGWIVLTQDVDEDDPILDLFAMSGKELSDYYKENGIYLYMIRTDPVVEIAVRMKDFDDSREIYDLNSISDEELLPGLGSMISEKVKGMTLYKHKQAKFYVYDVAELNNGIMIYGKLYFTIINGKMISITLHSHGSEISDELDKTAQRTVDSIVFTEVTPKPTFLSAILSLLKEIALVVGIIVIIVFVIRKRRKKYRALTGMERHTGRLGSIVM